MKTAQEWAAEINHTNECDDGETMPVKGSQLEPALLDAYRAGMLAAADLCLLHNDSGEGFKCHVAIGVAARDAVLPTVAPKV